MELKIKETAWGIDRIAGGGKGGRNFRIDELSGDKIVLTVRCADPKYNKAWVLKKGEKLTYRPRSFDGGYFYTFRLK